MTLQSLLFLLLILACPASMMLMMRGGHSMGRGTKGPADVSRQQRIDELEQELVGLRAADATVTTPEPIGPRT